MRLASALVAILGSPMTASAKIAATAALMLILYHGDMTMDATAYVVPDDALLMVVVLCVPVALLIGVMTALRSYTEYLNDHDLTAEEYPYSLNYALGTAAGIIIGGAAGIGLAGLPVGLLGIETSNSLLYALGGAVIAAFLTWFIVRMLHCGIETVLKTIKSVAQTVTEEAVETAEAVAEATDAVTEAVTTVKAKVTRKSTKTSSSDEDDLL